MSFYTSISSFFKDMKNTFEMKSIKITGLIIDDKYKRISARCDNRRNTEDNR